MLDVFCATVDNSVSGIARWDGREGGRKGRRERGRGREDWARQAREERNIKKKNEMLWLKWESHAPFFVSSSTMIALVRLLCVEVFRSLGIGRSFAGRTARDVADSIACPLSYGVSCT